MQIDANRLIAKITQELSQETQRRIIAETQVEILTEQLKAQENTENGS